MAYINAAAIVVLLLNDMSRLRDAHAAFDLTSLVELSNVYIDFFKVTRVTNMVEGARALAAVVVAALRHCTAEGSKEQHSAAAEGRR